MHTVTIKPHFTAWREKCRELLQAGVPPESVDWQDHEQPGLLLAEETPPPFFAKEGKPLTVPKDFFQLASSVAAHTDPQRWAVLYRLAYRIAIQGQRHLLGMPTDPDTRRCQVWAKAVGRDIHKMHAFVRFRLIGKQETTGREQFMAWFEPTHRIVQLATPFFVKRFAAMDWSILTPHECAHWDGHKLSFSPGMDKSQVPTADAHDDLWRTYYSSIFNPARLKIQAMQSEMPQKYWKNLPEADLIPGLIATSQQRMQTMLETELRPVKPAPNNAYLKSLKRGAPPGEEAE